MQYIVLQRKENEETNTFGPFNELEDARQWMLEDFSRALLVAEREFGKIEGAVIRNRSNETDLPEAHLDMENLTNQTWQILMLFQP